MNGIVGYTGFVGLNLLQFYKFDQFYNSENFEQAKFKHFDMLFFCGIPAVKWYANKNPENDTNIIENIKKILETISCNKFILISTIDVYDDVNNILLNENSIINNNNNHTYGKNRYLFEEFIKNKYQNHNIIRLPGLFGKGIKKNIIYDLINNNEITNIPINSSFQWYDLNNLKTDIDIVLKNNLKICNFFTEPIDTKEILNLFKKIYNIDYNFKIDYLGTNNNKIQYNLSTKYAKLFNSQIDNYIRNKNNILLDLEKFFIFSKMNKSKLCVSNICVNSISQLQFYCLLKLYGIQNIQIAPTKLTTWSNLNFLDLSIFKKLKLNVYSLQSITYTLDNLNIFNETKNELFKHLKNVIDFSTKNNIKVLVFGCPKNRKVINYDQNNEEIFIDFFKRLGDYCNEKDITICLENNSVKYNCNFMNKINDCVRIVKLIDKKNIKLMIDLGNSIMENDEWYNIHKYMDILYNIDVSNENMNHFANPDKINYIFNYVLKHNIYDKMINLEMLINDNNNELTILNDSINNFINIYSF